MSKWVSPFPARLREPLPDDVPSRDCPRCRGTGKYGGLTQKQIDANPHRSVCFGCSGSGRVAALRTRSTSRSSKGTAL